MVANKSGEVVKQITDILKLQTAELPSNIGMETSIKPNIYVNPQFSTHAYSTVSGTSGTSVLFYPAADRDFYVTSAYLSINKDATCDLATGPVYIYTTIAGLTWRILAISTITLTAQHETISISLPYPLKVDRGVAIQVSGTFTAGVLYRVAAITGFYI